MKKKHPSGCHPLSEEIQRRVESTHGFAHRRSCSHDPYLRQLGQRAQGVLARSSRMAFQEEKNKACALGGGVVQDRDKRGGVQALRGTQSSGRGNVRLNSLTGLGISKTGNKSPKSRLRLHGMQYHELRRRNPVRHPTHGGAGSLTDGYHYNTTCCCSNLTK